MQFSERSVLEWALVSVNIFNFPRHVLLKWLGDSLTLSPFSDDSIRKLEKARDGLKEKKEAAYLLFEEDLNFIVEAMRSFDLTFTESHLKKNVTTAFEYFSLQTPSEVSPLPLFVVDDFPENFEGFEKSSPFVSLPVDTESAGAGIYVKSDLLSPFLPIQLMEESIRLAMQITVAQIPEQNLPHRFFRLPWFEEGASLWMAVKAYFETFGDASLLKKYRSHLLTYHELSPSRKLQSFDIVRELFLSQRLEGAIESYLTSPKETDWGDLLTPLDFVGSESAGEVETFLLELSHPRIRQYVLPVEYLVMKMVGDGIPLEELGRTSGLPPKILSRTLDLLARRQFIFVDEDSVSLNSKFKDLFQRGLIKPSL